MSKFVYQPAASCLPKSTTRTLDCSVLAADTLSHDLELQLVPAHVGGLFNDHDAFDVDVGSSASFLQCQALIDAVRPVEAERWDNALTARPILKESFVCPIVTDVGDDVVEDDDDQFEVPGQPLQLLRVLVHELRPLDVVNRAVLLDEVLAHGVNVVNDDEFDLLLVDPGRQVDEQLVVLVDAVDVMDVNSSSNIVFSHWGILLLELGHFGTLGQEIV